MQSSFALSGWRHACFCWLAMLTVGASFICGASSATENGPTNLTPAQTAALSQLFDSPDHPLPIMPVAVPQAVTAQDIDNLLAATNRPAVFMISNATGPEADPIKVLFFQEMVIEYMNTVNFRKIAAGSPAALYLHGSTVVTKPVYIIADPSKTGIDRFLQLDEARYFDDTKRRSGEQGAADQLNWAVTQRTLEGGIYQKLGISPNAYAPYSLTAENHQKIVFETQPLSREPTAKWVSVLFYPSDPKLAGAINRIRIMLWMESFFFPGRIREMDGNLTTQGGVYRALLNREAPAEPELWLINPDKGQGVKYTSGQDGPPLAELTHETYVAWLVRNGIPAQPPIALNSEAIAQELLKLKAQQEAIQR
jgi:hypothetical protein